MFATKIGWRLVVLAAATLLLAGCGPAAVETGSPPAAAVTDPPGVVATEAPQPAAPTDEVQTSEDDTSGGQLMALRLTSSAFDHQSTVPSRFTCDGEDISPPLSWGDAPSGTAAYVLIMDDPDAPAGTWDHWVLFNLPADQTELAAGIEPSERLSGGGAQGRNSWRDLGYGGPCPPDGTHRYFFRLYALDGTLDLEPGASKEDVLAAMEGHVLGQAELMATYTR